VVLPVIVLVLLVALALEVAQACLQLAQAAAQA
jgi:hypothetical protein